MLGLEGFDHTGDDVVDRYILAGRFSALPHAKSSDDVDGTPDFLLFEVLDFFAFPRCYVMPGGFEGLAAVLCEVFAISDDDEFSGFGRVVVLDCNAPESSDKIDSVHIPVAPRKKVRSTTSSHLFLHFGSTKVRNYPVLHFFFSPASAILPMCPRLPGGLRE